MLCSSIMHKLTDIADQSGQVQTLLLVKLYLTGYNFTHNLNQTKYNDLTGKFHDNIIRLCN